MGEIETDVLMRRKDGELDMRYASSRELINLAERLSAWNELSWDISTKTSAELAASFPDTHNPPPSRAHAKRPPRVRRRPNGGARG